MSRFNRHSDGPDGNDWADDDFDADEDDADSAQAPCPACGAAVYEDADKCPRCGEWITPALDAERRSRTWFWPIAIVALIILLLMAWHGLGR